MIEKKEKKKQKKPITILPRTTHTYRPNSIRLFEILVANNKIVNMRNIDIVIAHRHL